MTEAEFVTQHEGEWKALEQALVKKRAKDAPAAIDPQEVPRLFRRLVAHLALARDRQYRTSLIDRLHAQVLSAHLAIHGARAQSQGGAIAQFRDFIANGFPLEARRQWRYVLVAALMFFGPFLGGILAIQFFPDFVHYLVDAETLGQMQSMYAPDAIRYGAKRQSDTDFMMFGFYIANNVRIDFQVVAGGIFFGVGALLILLFNGVMIGAVAGHLTHIGYGEAFWGFVAGHSAPELLGIVYSGAAGLMLGHALVAPGRLTRSEALRLTAPPAARLLYGAVLMTVLAAFIEAFWSSRVGLPFSVKLAFGSVLVTLFLLYLALGGRERAA